MPNFSVIRPTVFHYTEKGAHLHKGAQMYPTHDLCSMHRRLVSKHKSNLVTIGRAIPELYHSGNFDALYAARATCQGDPKMSQIRL